MSQSTYGPAQEDDLPAMSRAAGVAFAFPPEDSRKWIERVGLGSMRVVRDAAGAVAGQLLRADMGQFFGGRSVPMAGIAGVAVPPESRGTGVATHMMGGVLRELHAQGMAVSTLYAATQPLYRRVGYEQAGSRFEVRVPVSRLDAGDRGLSVRAATEADRPAVAECYKEMARHWDGWLDRGPYLWDRVWNPRGQAAMGWLAEGQDGVEGYIILQQSRQSTAISRHDLVLTDIGFRSPAGARRVLGLLADFGSMGLDVVMHCGPTHPVLLMLREQRWTMTLRDYWMVRIVDLPGAVAARGYAEGVTASVDLEVADQLLPQNSGRWRVRVEGGHGHATRGGSGAVRLGIGTLAALYAGYMSSGGLLQTGRLEADEAGLRAAAAVFPTGSPGMPDMF